MDVCFCIPARFKSTRLPEKLLLKINGTSCIVRTIQQVMKSKYYNNNIYVLTDDEKIKDEILRNEINCNIILTSSNYRNGTERICMNLHKIEKNTNNSVVVNIQADEPFISEKNIDFAIEKHIKNNSDNLFYSTLHEERNSEEYLKSTASLKLVTDTNDNVLYYSRNIIPWNKNNEIVKDYIYKTFTGIYVFNKDMLLKYSQMDDSELQMMEDCEQLKILEYGYKIKSYSSVEYNEISLNTKEDLNFLLNKYK